MSAPPILRLDFCHPLIDLDWYSEKQLALHPHNAKLAQGAFEASRRAQDPERAQRFLNLGIKLEKQSGKRCCLFFDIARNDDEQQREWTRKIMHHVVVSAFDPANPNNNFTQQ